MGLGEPSLQMATSLLLTAIIQKAQWDCVIIVFDDVYYESEVREVTGLLGERGTPFMLYHFSQLLQVSSSGALQMDSWIPLGADSWLHPLRFLLLCTPAHAALVLRQADRFQEKHKWRSALFITSQWLILEDPDAVESVDFSHVTMMHMVMVTCRAGKSCCSLTDLASPGQCGLVRALQWQREQRSVECLGPVPYVLGGPHRVFPGTKWGFCGRQFSVSTLQWKGFVETRKTATGKVEYYGLCIELINELATLLNFTYHLSEPEDGIWGIQYDNGTWAGLIGQLAYSKVDVVIAPLTVTYSREQVMDFTYPFFNDADTVIYKKPDPAKDKWRIYLYPLKWQVLVCIAISMVTTTLLLGFIESWTPFYPVNRLTGYKPHYISFFRSLSLVYGALVAQATYDHLPRSHSGRMVVSCWWLFSMVVAATYSGNLVAFFTVTKTKPLFDTLGMLLSHDTYRVGFMGGSAIHQTAMLSNTSLHRRMWSKVQQWMSEDPNYLTKDISVHKQRLLEGDYAFVSDKATLEAWAASDCTLELTKDAFLPIQYGVGLPNDSAFTRVISEKILLMHQNGQLGKLREKWWSGDSSCDHTSTTTPTSTDSYPSVSVVEMQSAFYLLFIGLVVSLLTLSVEWGVTLSLWATLHRCLVQEKQNTSR